MKLPGHCASPVPASAAVHRDAPSPRDLQRITYPSSEATDAELLRGLDHQVTCGLCDLYKDSCRGYESLAGSRSPWQIRRIIKRLRRRDKAKKGKAMRVGQLCVRIAGGVDVPIELVAGVAPYEVRLRMCCIVGREIHNQKGAARVYHS